MEDVWALGDLARELKRRERALGGLVRALKIRGGQALGGLVRALKIRGAGACFPILDIKECFTPHAPS